MNREKAIEKIKKCLALSSSSNEHEAAAALRQAQSLMQTFEIDEIEVLGVREDESRAGSGLKPTLWATQLARLVADTFECDLLYSTRRRKGWFTFVGIEPHPEIAKYVFDVLLRQLRHARQTYIRENIFRRSKAEKTRIADFYCTAWVMAAAKQVSAAKPPEEATAAIAKYIGSRYGELAETKTTNRIETSAIGLSAAAAIQAGHAAGKQAQLHQGVAGNQSAQPALLSHI